MMRQPIGVYVIKHPRCKDGLEIARLIYSEINRNIDDQTTIKSGIPVYYTDSDQDEDNRLIINTTDFASVAVVIFADSNMTLSSETGWGSYLGSLYKLAKDDASVRLFPVAYSENIMKADVFQENIGRLNFIRFYKHMGEDDGGKGYLIMTLRHELCRMLYNLEPIKDAATEMKRAVTIFLSHAKADGKGITKQIRDYINNDTAISDFFDEVDIPEGEDFEQEIQANILQSRLLLIVHTDRYANSEWCKMEVLFAKRNDIPILTVDCLKSGEERSFPYMGNTKTIRVDETDPNMARDVISCALEEVLRKKVHQVRIRSLSGPDDGIVINNNTPELLTIDLWQNKIADTIVYPEPPIGRYELQILKHKFENVSFITPIMLVSRIHDLNLDDRNISISVSKCESIQRNGITDIHCQAFIMDLARYLISFGATVMYGGNLFYRGLNFVQTLQNVLKNYSKDYLEYRKIRNYIPNYFAPNIDADVQVDNQNEIKFIKVSPGKDGNAKSDLTAMRETMASDMDVAIIAGGKMNNYIGRCPGVLEEFILALDNRKAIYIVGAFGGVAEKIADVINSCDKFFSTGKFIEVINEYTTTLTEEDKEFHSHILAVMENLQSDDLNNGLSLDENKKLMGTTNCSEAISIILRGLKSLSENHNI